MADSGFKCHSNRKLGVKQKLFFEFLHHLDSKFCKTVGMNIILLVDKFSAHEVVETIPSLNNLKHDFQPQNTTIKRQPLDVGIIATRKIFKIKRLM